MAEFGRKVAGSSSNATCCRPCLGARPIGGGRFARLCAEPSGDRIAAVDVHVVLLCSRRVARALGVPAFQNPTSHVSQAAPLTRGGPFNLIAQRRRNAKHDLF
jgi:hypothetical protein